MKLKGTPPKVTVKTIASRISERMKESQLSDYDIERLTGIAASTVFRIRTGKTKKPELGTVEKILTASGSSIADLYSSDSIRESPNIYSAESEFIRIPVIDLVKAGEWSEVADPYQMGDGMEFVPVNADNLGDNVFALVISGESMLPDFSPGDHIIVDPSVQPSPGRFVVAKLDKDNSATFKKYRPRGHDNAGKEVIELTPLNPDWPTLYINSDNPGRIIGTVVRHIRNSL